MVAMRGVFFNTKNLVAGNKECVLNVHMVGALDFEKW